MSEITYHNLAEKLVEAIPELKSQYEQELKWWGDEEPGAHNIYGDLLTPYLISLLKSDAQEETLRQIFVFLEKLANHDDVHVQEVVAFSILEQLGGDRELLMKARKYAGPKTLQFSHEVEAFWGRESVENNGKPAKLPEP